MIFQVVDLRVTAPLDPTKERRYVEAARGKELDNLYSMTTLMDDYINPIVECVLIWKSISSCVSNSEEALEHWQQRLHEVSTRRCARITCALRWIGDEVCDPPKYDGITDVDIFVKEGIVDTRST